MGQRFVAIGIEVDDKGTPKVQGLKNAFEDLDKTAQKVSTGGLKNAFDSTANLRTQVTGLGQDSDFVKNAMSALRADVAKLTPVLETAGAGAGAMAAGTAGAGAGLASMVTPVMALAFAIPLLIGLLSSAAFGSVVLSKHAAEAGGKIHELQQRTKLGAETLSALSVGAQLTGSDIGDLAGALDNFDKVVTRASAGDLKLSKQLRDSNIDITNNERALRSVFHVLNQMPEGQKRVELANLAFGASSKAVLEVIRETNGDIDLAIKKYGALGLILSNNATRAADKFNDQLTLLNLQIDSVKVRVGQQFMPTVLTAIQSISDSLERNSSTWVSWASEAVEAFKDVKAAAEDLVAVLPATGGLSGLALLITDLGGLLTILKEISAASGLHGLFEVLRQYGALRRPVDPNAIPSQDIPGLAVPLRQGGFTTEQIDKFQKELNPFINLFEGINARLETFGKTSHVAAVQQQALKLQIKELSPEVRDQAQAFIANALASAKQLDALEAQEKANKEAIKQAEKVTQANQNLGNEIDAVRLKTLQLGDAEGKSRTELEKFNEALIKRKDRDLLDPEAIDRARKAYEGLDSALTEIAKKKTSEKLAGEQRAIANSLQSIRENIAQAEAQAISDDQQRLEQRHAVLQRTAREIERIADLKIDRVKFAGLVELFKSGPDVLDLEQSLVKLRALIDPAVLDKIAPEKFALIIDALNRAAGADRKLTNAASPLAQANAQLDAQLKQLKNEVPVAAETAAKRYEIAWLDAYNGVVLASDAAVIQQIYSQAKLADSTIFHADQANAAVLDFLASQRSVTEVIADAKIGVIQTTFDLIDRGLDKFTSKLGVIGSLVRDLLSGFIRLALSKFFQSLYGGGAGSQPAFAGGSGGGGGIGSLIGNVFGGALQRGGSAGSAPFLTGGFAGGPGAGGFLGFGGSGGITNPQAAQAGSLGNLFSFAGGISAPVSLSSQLAQQASMSSVIQAAAASGAAGGAAAGAGGLLGSFGPAIGAMLPLLGLGLGGSLGGGSRFGSILGGAGGLLAGGIGAAFLAPSLFGATGALGSLGPMLAGLLTNPITLVAAPLLLLGAFLLNRNSARRRDETTRNQAMIDSLARLDEIIRAVRTDRMDGTSAIAAAMQVRGEYVSAMSQLKDSKTRRIALQDVYRLDLKIDQIKQATEGQQRRRDIEKRLVPEFAHGGFVPYSNTLFSMATGLTSIKVRPGEVMIPPGGFGMTVPGVDRGYDSVYTMAPPRTRVLTRSQAASSPGFANGGVVGGGGDNVLYISDERAAVFLKLLLEGTRGSDGKKFVIKTWREARMKNQL